MSNKAFVNESEISVNMGLKGIPNLAESLAVARDIELSRYTNSALHIVNITCAESVNLIRNAKQQGVKVTCSVNAMNLLFNENVYQGFESLYKVQPVLRSENDRNALIQGVLEGTIDVVNSNHTPCDLEGKEVEFEYAESGANTIEYTFSAVWKVLENKVSLEKFMIVK